MPFPFCLFDADDVGRWRALSTMDCVEFCLALEDTGLPFGAAGEPGATGLGSATVVGTGEEATEGDMAIEFMVLFL